MSPDSLFEKGLKKMEEEIWGFSSSIGDEDFIN